MTELIDRRSAVIIKLVPFPDRDANSVCNGKERFVLTQQAGNQKVIDIYSQLVETTFPR